MVRLTCLLHRKPGMSPEEFHRYWREVHGPLIAATRSGSHVVRYEQHPRPLESYAAQGDGSCDGVTVQWFESMAEYQAHLAEDDFSVIWSDIANFLDVDRLDFVVTEHPRVLIGEQAPGPLA